MSSKLQIVCLVGLVGLAALCLSGPSALSDDAGLSPDAFHQPGSKTVLVAPLETAEGLEVIISDVYIPAHGEVPPHSHPGEEFVYVIEGSAIHVEEGQADRVYSAGEAFVIRKARARSTRRALETRRPGQSSSASMSRDNLSAFRRSRSLAA